jgi:hypothetical protein
MTREEQQVRNELAALARSPGGRNLLQLALRGIHESGRGLTYGCWVKSDGGVSGCLFQHAYWQGLSEGSFTLVESPTNGVLKEYVGDEDFSLVMRSIRAFDALGRRRFRRWKRGPFGVPVRSLDEALWRSTVERILIDVLVETGGEAGDRDESTPRRPTLDTRA